MNQMKQKKSKIIAVLALLSAAVTVQAQPVVTYSVSGSSGDYTLDFTVNNTTPGTQGQDIYFLGVYDPNGTVSGIPTGDYSLYGAWNPYQFGQGGADIPYNLSWLDGEDSDLPTGTTVSGFDVLDTSSTAPTSVDYYACGFGYNGVVETYTGPGNLGPRDTNPLFEGVAVSTVPEPTTLALAGLGGVALLLRKRK
jgi:hypothetical protein